MIDERIRTSTAKGKRISLGVLIIIFVTLKKRSERETRRKIGEMRRVVLSSSASLATVTCVVNSRSVHHPGWKTKQSTKDVRSREQREIDRKARQIEKLPRPEALHDFQYPFEKTVLSDHMFQFPVFENELDTPHLFHLTPPPDFFVYWNVADFERTDYPVVPKEDHRLLVPSSTDEKWISHRSLAQAYLQKHNICPAFVPHVSHEANLSVTFSGTYGIKNRKDPETNALLPPPPPVTKLAANNFWFTSHFGNFIELCELQQAPSVFFTTQDKAEDAYYTLIIASPDYPYRTASENVASHSTNGFFLNYMVSNLKGGHSLDSKNGDVVVPYVAPLPTEDAGTTRHMCMLFKQYAHVPNVVTLGGKVAQEHFNFEARKSFRLHSERGHHPILASLGDVERSLPADPVALTFFQTAWDIQVQEFYEAHDLPEPCFQLDEELEAILRFNSLSSGQTRVNARHQPDGSVNMGTLPDGSLIMRQLTQTEPTRMVEGSMNNLWSRRTHLGKNGKPLKFVR